MDKLVPLWNQESMNRWLKRLEKLPDMKAGVEDLKAVVKSVNEDFPLKGLVANEEYDRFLHVLCRFAWGVTDEGHFERRVSVVSEVIGQLALAKHIPGMVEYMSELINQRMWKNAYNELYFIVQNWREIAEVQSRLSGKKSIDVLMTDGRLIELKVYNWDSPTGFFRDLRKRQWSVKGNADQIVRHFDRWKGSPIEVHFWDTNHPVAQDYIEALRTELTKRGRDDILSKLSFPTWMVEKRKKARVRAR